MKGREPMIPEESEDSKHSKGKKEKNPSPSSSGP